MEQKTRRGLSIGPQVIVGLAIVIFGLLLTANNLGFGRFSVGIRFWPMVFTVLGIAILLEKGTSSSRKFWGTALVIGGLWQTAVEAFGFRVYINDYWPLILVGLGVLLVVKSLGPKTLPADCLPKRRRSLNFWTKTSMPGDQMTPAILYSAMAPSGFSSLKGSPRPRLRSLRNSSETRR